jgi:predicted dienelactone hydrolase
MKLLPLLLFFCCAAAQAAMGTMDLPGLEGDGPVTVFYPTGDAEKELVRGPFKLQVAQQGAPRKGNGRLVVISHGSGGSPWTYTDIARTLVDAGFTVAFPEHRGDNYKDKSGIGPASWRRRPLEVSRAIDAVGKDARLAPLLQLDRVGVYGMSAGGHTALSFAGGRWSPATLKKHCEAHIAEDFATCVGPTTSLTGGVADGFKKTAALWVIAWRLNDANWVSYEDPRVKAAVAGVPYAVDFDMQSLAAPRVPLGLVVAGKDVWLTPRFHSDAVRAACKPCELVADIPGGGHGALLSPMPPLSGRLSELISDPPGFDRSVLPAVDRKIAAFFQKHL